MPYEWMDLALLTRSYTESRQVLQLYGVGYVFVHKDHHVVEELERWFDDLEHSVVDGAWYKVERVCFRIFVVVQFMQTVRWFRALRWMRRRLNRRRCVLAAAMGGHKRLGAGSWLGQLDPDLLVKVLRAL